jgi:hypothetical protein
MHLFVQSTTRYALPLSVSVTIRIMADFRNRDEIGLCSRRR